MKKPQQARDARAALAPQPLITVLSDGVSLIVSSDLDEKQVLGIFGQLITQLASGLQDKPEPPRIWTP